MTEHIYIQELINRINSRQLFWYINVKPQEGKVKVIG